MLIPGSSLINKTLFVVSNNNVRLQRFLSAAQLRYPHIQVATVSDLSISQSSKSKIDCLNEEILNSKSNFIVFVSANVRISKKQLSKILSFTNQTHASELFYFDSMINRSVQRRPKASPERLRTQFFWGGLIIISRSAFIKLQGLDSSLYGAEMYDLALRATRAKLKIAHIPEVIYSEQKDRFDSYDWSVCGEKDSTAIEQALSRHLELTGGGQILSIGNNGVHHTQRSLNGTPLVSIIIPTKARMQNSQRPESVMVSVAVQSIVSQSTYQNYEIVVVIDKKHDVQVVDYLRSICGERLREVYWDQPFNFSSKVNLGAVASQGNYLLFLNDDVKIITPSWIEALLALAQIEGAGMSGAMLYYEDSSIQHAGHAYRDNHASHIGLDEPNGSNGPLHGYKVEREIGGVTAACCMVPREVFYKVGGFSSLLPGAFNDVDLCMKVTTSGYKIYWTPYAELYHYESKSRDARVREFEVDLTWKRWGNKFMLDEYWPYPLSRSPE